MFVSYVWIKFVPELAARFATWRVPEALETGSMFGSDLRKEASKQESLVKIDEALSKRSPNTII